MSLSTWITKTETQLESRLLSLTPQTGWLYRASQLRPEPCYAQGQSILRSRPTTRPGKRYSDQLKLMIVDIKLQTPHRKGPSWYGVKMVLLPNKTDHKGPTFWLTRYRLSPWGDTGGRRSRHNTTRWDVGTAQSTSQRKYSRLYTKRHRLTSLRKG